MAIKNITPLLYFASSIVFLSVMIACSGISDTEASHFVDFDNRHTKGAILFSWHPAMPDSSSLPSSHKDISISVRYTPACRISTLPLEIEFMSLTQDVPDTLYLELPLFNSSGQPSGKGAYGIFETTRTVASDTTISEGCIISVSSPLDRAFMSGIKSMGIIVSKPKHKTI